MISLRRYVALALLAVASFGSEGCAPSSCQLEQPAMAWPGFDSPGHKRAPDMVVLGDMVVPPDMAQSAYALAVQANSPIGWWRELDTVLGSGQPLVDSSGGAHNATIVTGFTPTTALVTGDSQALDNADTLNGYATIDTLFFILAGDFTLESWAMAPTLPVDYQWGVIGGTGGGVGTIWADGGKIGFSVTGFSNVVQDPSSVVATTRYYIVVTRSGTTVTLYINATSVSTGTDIGPTPITLSYLAYGGAGAPKNIVVSEQAIYNTALSPTDITAHWTAGM